MARSSKSRTASVTQWGSTWSWSKLIDVLLSPEGRQERIAAARDLLELQEDGFRKLRAAIEDPSQREVSWDRPFLRLFMEFPYEWDTEISLSEVDATDPWRNLMISLFILTAGLAVQPANGDISPLLPSHLCGVVGGFTEKELQTHLNRWFDSSSFRPRSLGDNHFEDPEDRTLSRIGQSGVDFVAALNFSISPRLIDHKRKKSGFIFLIGVPWVAEETASPKDWSNDQRNAFWTAISRFLLTVQEHLENPKAVPSRIVEAVRRRGRSKSSLQFVASITNSRGVSYFEKACVAEISRTALARVPPYARGEQGPVLEHCCPRTAGLEVLGPGKQGLLEG